MIPGSGPESVLPGVPMAEPGHPETGKLESSKGAVGGAGPGPTHPYGQEEIWDAEDTGFKDASISCKMVPRPGLRWGC